MILLKLATAAVVAYCIVMALVNVVRTCPRKL